MKVTHYYFLLPYWFIKKKKKKVTKVTQQPIGNRSTSVSQGYIQNDPSSCWPRMKELNWILAPSCCIVITIWRLQHLFPFLHVSLSIGCYCSEVSREACWHYVSLLIFYRGALEHLFRQQVQSLMLSEYMNKQRSSSWLKSLFNQPSQISWINCKKEVLPLVSRFCWWSPNS